MLKTFAPGVGAKRVYYLEILAGDGISPEHTTTTALSVMNVNRVHYSPITVPMRCTVDAIGVCHGLGGAGNMYLGLYDSLNYAPNALLAVSPNTAKVGASQMEYVLFTSALQIGAGLYFGAYITDNGLDQINRGSIGSAQCSPANVVDGSLKWYTEDMGAYVPPPNIAAAAIQTSHLATVAMWLRISSIP